MMALPHILREFLGSIPEYNPSVDDEKEAGVDLSSLTGLSSNDILRPALGLTKHVDRRPRLHDRMNELETMQNLLWKCRSDMFRAIREENVLQWSVSLWHETQTFIPDTSRGEEPISKETLAMLSESLTLTWSCIMNRAMFYKMEDLLVQAVETNIICCLEFFSATEKKFLQGMNHVCATRQETDLFVCSWTDESAQIIRNLLSISKDHPKAQQKLGAQITAITHRMSLPHVPIKVADFWKKSYGEYVGTLVVKDWSRERPLTDATLFCTMPGCVTTEAAEMMCGRCKSVRYCSSKCQKS